MAKILPFTLGDTNRKKRVGGAVCEIVIFPGVRVEYNDGPPTPDRKGRSRRRRRGAAKRAALA